MSTKPQDSCTSATGPAIGILMLDTHFPRFPGDIGNLQTWPFRVHLNRIDGAFARAVVNNTGFDNLQPFIQAAKELEQLGVLGITSSCGFLVLAQQEMCRHLKVPFVSSSLMQIPWVNSMLPAGKKTGVLTIDSAAITQQHLQAAQAPADTPIAGTQNGREFTNAILNDRTTMDQQLCEKDNIEAALQLVEQHPEVGAVVLECTNMAPYTAAISHTIQRPVYSIYTLLNWFHSGLVARDFSVKTP